MGFLVNDWVCLNFEIRRIRLFSAHKSAAHVKSCFSNVNKILLKSQT